MTPSPLNKLEEEINQLKNLRSQMLIKLGQIEFRLHSLIIDYHRRYQEEVAGQTNMFGGNNEGVD